MCGLCRADEAEVKRMYARQGAVDEEDFFKEVNYTLRKKRKGKCKRSKTGEDHVFNASKHKHNGPLTFRYFVCSRCGKLGGLYKVE